MDIYIHALWFIVLVGIGAGNVHSSSILGCPGQGYTLSMHRALYHLHKI